MNLFDRFNKWLESQVNPQQPTLRTTRQQLNDRARIATYVEQYDMAMELFQQAKVMAIQSQDLTAIADAKLNLADVLIKRDQLDKAQEILEQIKQDTQARSHYAPLAYTLCSLGIIAQKRQQWDIARAHFEDARTIAQEHQLNGAEGRASGHLADVYLHENNASYAIHLLRNAIKQLETSGDKELVPYFMAQLGRALIDIGDVEQGQGVWHNALFVASVSRQIPMVRLINHLLGDHAYGTTQYKDANIHYQEMLRHQSNYAPDHVTRITLHSRIAYSHHKTHQRHQAQERILENKLDFEHPQAPQEARLISAIVLAHHTEHATQAIGTLESMALVLAPPLTPVALDAIETLAQHYQKHGNVEKALQLYEQFVQKSDDAPTQAELQVKIGYLYLAQGQNQQARTIWEQALKQLATQDNHARTARLYCDLGELYMAQGQGARCQDSYDNALTQLSHIKQTDVRGVVLANAAIAHNRFGDIENAEPFFREAIDIAERTQNTYAEMMRRGNYGVFLAQIGDVTPAQTALQHAYQQAQKSADTLAQAIQQHNLGYGYAIAGDYKQAEQHYQQARTQFEQLGDDHWLTICLLNLADIHLKQNQLDHVTSLLAHIPTQQSMSHVPLHIATSLERAYLAWAQNDIATTQAHLEAQEYPLKRCKMPRLILRAQHLQALIARHQGDDEQAQKLMQKAQDLMQRLRMSNAHLPIALD
jgi:tetratricopeptide (TPR) repeat protein